MKYNINYGNSVAVLPCEPVLSKLKDAGEVELKFLLAFICNESLQSDYEGNIDSLSKELSIDRADLDSALSFWRGTGIITVSGNKQKEKKIAKHATLPSYTGEELSKIIDENGLATVIDECQRITGKIFNITEVNRIAALNSYLGMSAEHILLLFAYCSERDNISLKYIEKTAYNLYDNGIDNLEKFEDYIKSEEEKRMLESKLRTLFGWGERSLTPSEKKHIAQWSNEFNYSLDIITEAYNITVEKTGKLALAYLSKILANWHEH
ncbi:MAG: DnaD domain protein, partial [Clostridia bacterium]|nr:DnaD domain protein [Clostridia bacterium]